MKIAVLHHFLPHYRYKIFNLLSCSYDLIFTFFSSSESFDGIKSINKYASSVKPIDGGINWRFVRNIRLGKHFLWQNSAIQLALSNEFDVIIYFGNMCHLSSWVGAILARISGKKVLMWTHGFLRNETGFKGFIRLCFYRLADGLLLYGHHSKDILINKGYPEACLEVVYNSLDYEIQKAVRESFTVDYLSQLKAKLFLNVDLPVLIFIGRLTQQKKLHQLLEAVHELHKRSSPVNVLFVGIGPESNRLAAMTSVLGLSPFVCFYGETYDEKEIGGLISISNICVSPGEVGLTSMHVMAYGVPVISHGDFDFQMPEYEAIQPGVTGEFFDSNNINNLVEKILFILKFDKLFFRQNCIDKIEKFYNPNVQAEIICKFIKKICNFY